MLSYNCIKCIKQGRVCGNRMKAVSELCAYIINHCRMVIHHFLVICLQALAHKGDKLIIGLAVSQPEVAAKVEIALNRIQDLDYPDFIVAKKPDAASDLLNAIEKVRYKNQHALASDDFPVFGEHIEEIGFSLRLA